MEYGRLFDLLSEKAVLLWYSNIVKYHPVIFAVEKACIPYPELSTMFLRLYTSEDEGTSYSVL